MPWFFFLSSGGLSASLFVRLCDIPEKVEEIYRIAEEIKLAFYGNRIVMFAPLYLSNYCVNGCLYCPYHMTNRHITRKKLTQEEVKQEVGQQNGGFSVGQSAAHAAGFRSAGTGFFQDFVDQ